MALINPIKQVIHMDGELSISLYTCYMIMFQTLKISVSYSMAPIDVYSWVQPLLEYMLTVKIRDCLQ